MLAETSKYIEDTAEKYSVTEAGRVYRHSYISPTGHLWKGRWLKSTPTARGYQTYSINDVKVPAHRLVAQAFLPNPENKPFVNHLNGIKTDNHLENLEWCTASENLQHAYDTGLKVGTKKFSDEDVAKVRALHSTGNFTQTELAEMYGMSRPSVSMYINNKVRL